MTSGASCCWMTTCVLTRILDLDSGAWPVTSGHGWVEELVRGFCTKYWKRRIGKQADLFEHRGLVPVDAFVRQFALAKAYHHDQRNLNAAMSRWNTGEHPGHLFAVGEGEDHFVYQLILADGARDQLDRGVRRHRRDEVFFIKSAQAFMAVTAGHHRHVVDVCIVNHGGDGRRDIAGGKLIADVLVPSSDHLCLVHGSTFLWKDVSRLAAGVLTLSTALSGGHKTSAQAYGRVS